MIPTFEEPLPTRDHPNLPFPPDIADDPCVLYHGTSSANEERIEQDGLLPGTSIFSRRDVEAVVAVFDHLRWAGCSSASLPILKPFSLRHDLGDPRGKPLFLAEYAHRAMLYASRDFAGGEIARSIRYSFQDLDAYLNEDAVREEHRCQIEREREEMQLRGGVVPAAPDPDLARLASDLLLLTELRTRATAVASAYSHGTVYAIRISAALAKTLAFGGSMGIKAFSRLPPSSLVGRARVSATYVHDPMSSPQLHRVPAYRGVLQTLAVDGARNGATDEQA